MGAVVLSVAGVLSVVSGSGTPVAAAGVSPGVTTLVSVKDDGSQSDTQFSGTPGGMISGDGRFVVFSTYAVLDDKGPIPVDGQNDTTGANGKHESDIYVRDRQTGHTTLISRGIARTDSGVVSNVPGNGQSTDPSISANGRFVAFDSYDDNLDLSGFDHDNSPDVYLCDRDPDRNGVFDEVVHGDGIAPQGVLDIRCSVQGRAPLDDKGARAAYNIDPTLAADGNTIAWDQVSVGRDSTGAQPFNGIVVAPVHFDIESGQLDRTSEDLMTNVSLTDPDFEHVGGGNPLLSADGFNLAFWSIWRESEPPIGATPGVGGISGFTATTALAPGDQSFRLMEVHLTAKVAGATPYAVTNPVRMNVGEDGKPLNQNLCCNPTGISGDGRYVAFNADQTPFAAMIADRDAAGGPRSIVVSKDNTGKVISGGQPVLTRDGRYVAYTVTVPNAHNGRDNASGSSSCSRGEGGVDPSDTCSDVVVRDLELDRTRSTQGLPRLPAELASPGLARDCVPDLGPDESCEGNGDSGGPSLADNGSVAYGSGASDLVQGDGNGAGDMFVRDFRPTIKGDPLNFGVVDLGDSATEPATIHHVGFGPVVVDGVELGGDNAGDFTIVDGSDTCSGVVLVDPDIPCGISITFTPGAEGERHATLTVHPQGRDPITIPITGGVGVPPDGFKAQPDPLDFGQRLALSPGGPKTVTVTNTGRVPFVVRNVTLPNGTHLFGKDYRVVQNTCVKKTIPVGGSCTLGFIFTSHGMGQRPAAVQVTTQQVGTTTLVPHVVGLRGHTPTAELTVNPGVVVDGRVTSLSGTNFAQNAQVVLTLSPGETIVVKTDAAGSFSTPYLVMRKGSLGGRTVTGIVVGTTLKAEGTLLVVAGSFQPPDFNGRS